MKAVLQRVSSAKVTSGGRVLGEIGQGLAVLLGVVTGDGVDEADFLAEKAAGLRVFEDENGKMNKSLLEVGGGMLVVSNFTLCADARRGGGRITGAAAPEEANALYLRFVAAAKDTGVSPVSTGRSARICASRSRTTAGDHPARHGRNHEEITRARSRRRFRRGRRGNCCQR